MKAMSNKKKKDLLSRLQNILICEPEHEMECITASLQVNEYNDSELDCISREILLSNLSEIQLNLSYRDALVITLRHALGVEL